MAINFLFVGMMTKIVNGQLATNTIAPTQPQPIAGLQPGENSQNPKPIEAERCLHGEAASIGGLPFDQQRAVIGFIRAGCSATLT